MLKPVDTNGHRDDEPKKGVGQVQPNGILHPLNIAVPFCVFMNVHLQASGQYNF